MSTIIERFKSYIAIDTKSDESNPNCPSSPGQLVLGKKLVDDLKELGVKDAYQDKHGYVYGSLKSNIDKKVPTIGLIAHMDTSPDLDGKCVNPQILTYNGGDIKLNDTYSLTVKEFPFLNDLIGHELITTDGTTLLGSDDKSGITIIMEAIKILRDNPSIKHGDIKIGFTPDEEIGRGASLFNVEEFAADFAYTLDGGPLGELEYENFNAASVDIHIKGKNVHPGSAKNIMINAIVIGMELNSLLPSEQRPEHTEHYEGFFLLQSFNGTVDDSNMKYLIRDHSKQKFNDKKILIENAINFLNKKYGDIITFNIKDRYFNMREKIEPHMEIVHLAKEAMEELNIEPLIKPIRGGTDGARLSYMGLPCPNLFTGGYNFHGRFELLSVDTLKKAIEVVVKLVERNTL